jgi:formylmethanofuran dehydrogenase subunit E
VKKDAPPPSTTVKGEDMVTCARCGVNLPRSEATEADGLLVCRDNPKCLESARP